jgi:hypothetical protein
MSPARAALAALLAGAGLAGCAAAPGAGSARTIALPNADLEAASPAGARCPPRWACNSHADPSSHRFFLDTTAPAAGKASLCIERVTREPWAIATLASLDPALRGMRVRYSANVRVDGATDGGGPWVLVHGPHGNLLHDQRLVRGTTGWQPIAFEFGVSPEARIVEVGAILEGPGRVCLDDVRLEIL